MTALESGQLGSLTADRYRTVREAMVVEMLLLAGWAFALEAGHRGAAAAAAGAAIEGWIALGLGHRRNAEGDRCFDPVEVVNFLIWTGRCGLDGFWADRYVHAERALVASLAATTLGPQRMRLSLRRRFGPGRSAAGKPARLRLPLPLAGASISDIVISPRVAPALAEGVSLADGRMDVRVQARQDESVEIGADVSFLFDGARPAGARPTADSLDPDERALFLRCTEGLIHVSPRVQALADALAGAARTPWATLRAFWDYMMDTLFCGAVHYDQITEAGACDWVLDHRWYDCRLGSALLVALCRARGIPARMIGGHVLYRLAPTNHYWLEAWIDGHGWMPFDLASWGLSLGGRDRARREHFFGRIDTRLTTQVLPQKCTGPIGVRFPPCWHMVQTAIAGGVSIAFLALDGGLIHEDTVVLA